MSLVETPGVGRQWHALPIDQVEAAVGTDVTHGLAPAEAATRLSRFGRNALPEPARRHAIWIVLHQFRSPLIYLLLVAAGVAFVVGKASDAAVIAAVVLLNAVVGAFQEGRAERALDALRLLARHEARVIRGARESVVEAGILVPGDVLVLQAGDAVTADARIVRDAAFQTAEAALTGESVPVAKAAQPIAADTPLAERRSMVYAGTHVASGRAVVVVVATGLATEFGRIAALAVAAEQPQTPLERRIARFGRHLVVAALAMFAVVNLVGVLRGIPFAEIVMVGVSQIVGMIPEGLPVAMTIALAVGVQRMARRGAVVRRLAAVETLGSTSVICSDKTGTLTRNEMTVTTIHLCDGREVSVSGAGYAPVGEFAVGLAPVAPQHDAPLAALLEAAVLCNDAHLAPPDAADSRWRPLGDPTEAALLTVGGKSGIVPERLRARVPRRAELPFDASTKMMATQHETPAGPTVVVKGAPEAVLDLCGAARHGDRDVRLDDGARDAVRAAADRMGARALRVLAVAVAEGAEIDVHAGFAALRGRMTLLGLLGQIDPPRPEVADAVRRCREAGIRPVMVTGDHKATGIAVARALGISRDGDAAVDGTELERMSDKELAARIAEISVYARVHPAQKLRIVEAYQQRHEVVAMTGDGVNDAPALVRADVGVAMGITGTEVAKEAAKIVITDDNFATIVAAVDEGRVVYRNIKKVVLYLFATSMAEVLVLLGALLLGYPPPLAAVQILWINLVTEGTVTVNLIMEPPEGDEMHRMPVSRVEPLLTRTMLVRMALMTPVIAAVTLGWFLVRHGTGVPFAQVQTETFTMLAVCQWFNVMNCRSELRSALTMSIFANPWLVGGLVLGNLLQAAVVFMPALNHVFHTVPFGFGEFAAIGAVASSVLWTEELRKIFARRRARCPVPMAA